LIQNFTPLRMVNFLLRSFKISLYFIFKHAACTSDLKKTTILHTFLKVFTCVQVAANKRLQKWLSRPINLTLSFYTWIFACHCLIFLLKKDCTSKFELFYSLNFCTSYLRYYFNPAVPNLGYAYPPGVREKSLGVRQIFISSRLLIKKP